MALDVDNDGVDNKEGVLKMAPSANYSGQFWQFMPQLSGEYKLCTMFLGPDRVLDVYGNDKTKPHMARVGNYSGQLWVVEGWGDGTWKSSNAYSGKKLHLDTYAGTYEPFMGDRDHAGQYWTITAIKKVWNVVKISYCLRLFV
ncbi:putative Ricin B-related lectin [Penicillium oxalicum 114-2]|uniref:Putative Ricin B-related lectin n=1 Tax=Penicillium oxalicum (strain 114-2 / CGMCC 5302) TaxID=933388 RepID=S7ZL88_PENO1|nr:putative Ricin B-related lectin [Penicillium oxalicum 114-2]